MPVEAIVGSPQLIEDAQKVSSKGSMDETTNTGMVEFVVSGHAQLHLIAAHRVKPYIQDNVNGTTASALKWRTKCQGWKAPSLEALVADDTEADDEIDDAEEGTAVDSEGDGEMDEAAFCTSEHFSLDIVQQIHSRLAKEQCSCGGVSQRKLDLRHLCPGGPLPRGNQQLVAGQGLH